MRKAIRGACALLCVQAAACSSEQTCAFERLDHRVGTGASAVATGDLDHDGDVDLVVTNNTDGTVSVLLGDGAGGFGPRVDHPTRNLPYAVAVADLDRDGHLDLAVGNGGAAAGGGGGVSVLLGNGDGTFQPKVDSPPDPALCPNADGVAVGDFDADGVPDLIVANDLPSGVASVSLLLGNGDGTFGAPLSSPTGNATESVATGDFDADGKVDAAAANHGSSTVTVLLGDGLGGFASSASQVAGGGPYFVATADLDGDGDLDLVTANQLGSTVSVLRGNGDGTFGAEVRYPTGPGATSVTVADLDGDGLLDLATANAGGATASLLHGNGNGTFGTRTDLAVANWSAGTVSVLLRACSR